MEKRLFLFGFTAGALLFWAVMSIVRSNSGIKYQVFPDKYDRVTYNDEFIIKVPQENGLSFEELQTNPKVVIMRKTIGGNSGTWQLSFNTNIKKDTTIWESHGINNTEYLVGSLEEYTPMGKE